jgi:hypothetical protein
MYDKSILAAEPVEVIFHVNEAFGVSVAKNAMYLLLSRVTLKATSCLPEPCSSTPDF